MKTSDFNYILPDEKIAPFPLENRSDSKLLVYKDGIIVEDIFHQLGKYLPKNTLICRNTTRVIPARMYFKRDSGAEIEVFCLSPIFPYSEVSKAMEVKGNTIWKCMARKSKKWKEGETLSIINTEFSLHAKLKSKIEKYVEVEFSWFPNELPWIKILEKVGNIPIPTYFKRLSNLEDESRYQTVFAKHQGAVAAPTASFHFDEGLLKKIESEDHSFVDVTLHISAGTFLPVTVDEISDHQMHSEQIEIDLVELEKITNHNGQICALGTTSLRTLESLYWIGFKLWKGLINPFIVDQEFPYINMEESKKLGFKDACLHIIDYMKFHNVKRLFGETSIMIRPEYQLKSVDALITNFHQPESTLLMLVSCYTNGNWKEIYDYALSNQFRFLSYGDCSILFRPKF